MCCPVARQGAHIDLLTQMCPGVRGDPCRSQSHERQHQQAGYGRVRRSGAARCQRVPAAGVPLPVSNTRTDSYGGSPENRARLVIQGVLETDRADVTATYTALVDGIADLKPAYLSILHKDPADEMVQALRHRFGGPVLLNTGFGTVTTRDDAIMLLEENLADAAAGYTDYPVLEPVL
jgi:hypothetical protein